MARLSFKIVIGFLLLLILPISVYAQEGKSITVEFLPQAVMNQSFAGVQEFHYIGGQEVVIPFWVHSSNKKSLFLYAEGTQVGYSMQAPYDMTAKITPNGSTEKAVARKISLMLPKVKRETKFTVIISIKEEQYREVGRVHITIYPENILEPLHQWAKNYQVRLKDSVWQLAEVFEKNEIEFVDYRAALPKNKNRPVVTIIVGEPEEGLLEDRRGSPNESIIILRESYRLLPKVMVSQIKTGTLVDVELKVVEDLAQNPIHQKMLLEIIKLTNTFNQ